MYIGFGMDQDEWLITPTVSIPAEGTYNFSFDLWVEPLWFFNLDKIDWETYTFSEYEIICDYQVMVKVGDGEWSMIKSIANDWIGKDYMELSTSASDANGKLVSYKFPLSDYAGQQIQLAVRYVGNDGNSTLLDNVRVALPSMDGVKMQVPFSTQYFGLTDDLTCLTIDIASFPVFAPITFENYSDESSFDYWWLYSDPETTEMVRSDEESLELTYHTDYTSDFTTRHNLYYPPVLCAAADGYSDTQVAMPVDYIQPGGENTWEVSQDGQQKTIKMGMLPFALNYCDLDFAAAETESG